MLALQTDNAKRMWNKPTSKSEAVIGMWNKSTSKSETVVDKQN